MRSNLARATCADPETVRTDSATAGSAEPPRGSAVGQQGTDCGVVAQRFRGRQGTAAFDPFKGRSGLCQGDGDDGHKDGQDNQQLQDQVLPGEGHSSSSSHVPSFLFLSDTSAGFVKPEAGVRPRGSRSAAMR